jgi:LysR family transcriptional regulator of abg operon
MKLSSIRDFMAVAEHGSLRAAARHLEMAQPAITRSIQELEKELGADLFERRAKGVALTPMGERFLKRSRTVQGELTRAQAEMGLMRNEIQARIRVAMSGVPHMALFPNAILPFRQRYPEVRLEIVDGLLPSVETQLKDGTVDCYIGPILEETSTELSAEELFIDEMVIVARHGHPLAGAKSLRDLAQAEWVTSSITHRAEEELGPIFAKHGLDPPRRVLHGHSALTFLFTIAYSDLLMMLPVQWTQSPLFRGVLQRIPIAEKLPAPPVCIVQRGGLPLTPAAEYFCDMMRRAARHMDTLLG